MNYELRARPKILTVASRSLAPCVLPDEVEWLSWSSMPARDELLSLAWDYLYVGFDCRALDCRFFTVVLEHVAIERPDVIIVSSPKMRFLTGVFDTPMEIFQTLCTVAEKGGLYYFGNKLISRGLFETMPVAAQGDAGFLTLVFRNVSRLSVLSHPYVTLNDDRMAPPSDDEFFAFIERYTGR